MYQKYAEAQGWRFEVMEASMNGVGGFKEVVAMVSGQSVYSKLKYESGATRARMIFIAFFTVFSAGYVLPASQP